MSHPKIKKLIERRVTTINEVTCNSTHRPEILRSFTPSQAPKNASADKLQPMAVRAARTSVWDHPLPWCIHARGSSPEIRPHGSQSAGKTFFTFYKTRFFGGLLFRLYSLSSFLGQTHLQVYFEYCFERKNPMQETRFRLTDARKAISFLLSRSTYVYDLRKNML